MALEPTKTPERRPKTRSRRIYHPERLQPTLAEGALGPTPPTRLSPSKGKPTCLNCFSSFRPKSSSGWNQQIRNRQCHSCNSCLSRTESTRRLQIDN